MSTLRVQTLNAMGTYQTRHGMLSDAITTLEQAKNEAKGTKGDDKQAVCVAVVI